MDYELPSCPGQRKNVQSLQEIPGIPEKLWNLTLTNFLQCCGNSLKAPPDKLSVIVTVIKFCEKGQVSLKAIHSIRVVYLKCFTTNFLSPEFWALEIFFLWISLKTPENY